MEMLAVDRYTVVSIIKTTFYNDIFMIHIFSIGKLHQIAYVEAWHVLYQSMPVLHHKTEVYFCVLTWIIVREKIKHYVIIITMFNDYRTGHQT